MPRRLILLATLAILTTACDAQDPASESSSEVSETTVSVELDLDDMTCVNCAADIEEAFDESDTVIDGTVDFANRRAHVDYDPDHFDEDDVIAVVEDAGYEAELRAPED